MKIVSKSSDRGSLTIFTKGRHALYNINVGDNPAYVPDPILSIEFNSTVRFRSVSPGFCEVDWGDGVVETFPFVRNRSDNRYYIYFRALDIDYYKNPDSHPWWFYKDDGSEYIPVPPHTYADGEDKDRVITFRFTNNIDYFSSERNYMSAFPILDAPTLEYISIGVPQGIKDIPFGRIQRSVNLKELMLLEFGRGTIKQIPEDWNKLRKLVNLSISMSCDFSDTETSNLRKLPSMFPDLRMLAIGGCYVRVYPREFLDFNNLTSLSIHPGNKVELSTGPYDPDQCPDMSEVDKINTTLTGFNHLGFWMGGGSSWHPYMEGKGLERITSLNAHLQPTLDNANIPSYLYEMRAMNEFYRYRSLTSQVASDTFFTSLYDKVMAWDKLTMTSVAADGLRNQFYGLRLIVYSVGYPTDYRPSGELQAPEGFVKGVSNGNPATPMEMVYVLQNNYGWRFSLPPASPRSRAATPNPAPYALVLDYDGAYVASGDILTSGDIHYFGGQPEGEYLCDRLNIDKMVVTKFFKDIEYGESTV